MAKRKPGRQRPFNAEALDPYAVAGLLPRLVPRRRVWRYVVTVPLEQIKPTPKQKATPPDQNQLRRMFVRHFGGVTLLPPSPGYGLRDPDHPEQEPAMNYNGYFVVLASPVPAADRYFRALWKELEDSLAEGVILVERHVIWIP